MLAIAVTAITATYLFASLLALAPRKAGVHSHVKHSISETRRDRSTRSALCCLWPLPALSAWPCCSLPTLLALHHLQQQLSRSASQSATLVRLRFPAILVTLSRHSAPSSSTILLVRLSTQAEDSLSWRSPSSFGQPFKTAEFIVLGTTIALSSFFKFGSRHHPAHRRDLPIRRTCIGRLAGQRRG